MGSRPIHQCGFCIFLSELFRKAMCIRSRRGSRDSYYRELGDQDTLKIEDKGSDVSDDTDDNETENDKLVVTISADVNCVTQLQQPSLNTGRFLTIHKRRKKRLVTRSLSADRALLDDMHPGQMQVPMADGGDMRPQLILDKSVHWKFNAFALDNVSGGRCLPLLCIHLLHVYDLFTHFKLDIARAWKLFCLIEEGYHSMNPYHNSIHAADVTQAMHCFLQQKQIRDHMEPIEVLASLLAAMAHDIDHPGVNQQFLIATSNHLAALYKNTSVLENHHWRCAISCIKQSGILDEIKCNQAQLENQITSLILATDITRQQEYLSQFKGHMDNKTLDMTKKEHRHLVLQIALKCADISNPCRSWDISQKWSLKVCEEFFNQGDYERRLNLPVTALCDRNANSIPKIQTGFFQFVVIPLINEWHRFLNNDLSVQMLKNLSFNYTQWEILAAQDVPEASEMKISDAEVVEDEQEPCTRTNVSDSAEPLLPPRRSSLSPGFPKQPGFKEQLRRLSMPLNVFYDARTRGRAKSKEEDVENLLPETSIASITTPTVASRLSSVLRAGGGARLLRQQTFPTSGAVPRDLSRRRHTTTTAQVLYEDITKMFKKTDNDKTDNDDASENNNIDESECPRNLEIENFNRHIPIIAQNRRVSAPVGSHLKDNLTSAHINSFGSEQLLHRRKSMPTNTLNYQGAKEKKMREVTCALPQILRRTLSGRRSSEPAPLSASEARGLAARRKTGTLGACHWLVHLHSLSAEIIHPTDLMEPTDSK